MYILCIFDVYSCMCILHLLYIYSIYILCIFCLQECSGSVCSLIGAGWKECSLSSEEASSAAALCYVSCADPSGTCFSSYDEKSTLPADFQALLTIYGDSNGKISAKPGSAMQSYFTIYLEADQ